MRFLRALLLRLFLLFSLLVGIIFFLSATTPGVQLTLRITNLLLPGKLTVQKLEGHFWKQLAFDTLSYQNAKQNITLKDAKLKWHIDSLYPLKLTLETLEINQLKLSDDKTNITLDTLKLSGNFNRSLHLNGDTRLILPQGILNINIQTEDELMTSYFTLGNNRVVLKGPVRGPWKIHADLAGLKQLDKRLEPLKSTIVADATVYNMKNAVLNAKLTPGHYQRPKGESPEQIHFEALAIKAHLNPKRLKLSAYWALDKNTSGRLNLDLPKVRINNPPTPKQAISGQATVQVHSLSFLDAMAENSDVGLIFQKPRGQLNALIDISGTVEKPKLVGHIALKNGEVTLPDLGLTLRPVELNIKTDGSTWEGSALIQPEKSPPLTIRGKGDVTPGLTGTIVLDGDKVVVMDTTDYHIKASPKITLTKKADAYELNGTVLIPEARITPLSFIHADRLTRDAVFVRKKQEPNPLNFTTDVTVSLGDDVRINFKGAQGHVDGQLKISQLPKQALTADGEIKLRDGYYEAYGQKLDIEQGELIFIGQQIDNPYIRVRAIRHFSRTNEQFEGSNQLFDFSAENLETANFGENTTVGITVSGRVDSPKVKLFSSPPNLSQADILSMLLLGKPADHVGKSGGQLLIQAMTSMHLTSGSKGVKMLQDIQKSMGIDFDVQNKSLGTESSDFSKTSVSIGKAITKRIYLQYNVGLFKENSSVFTLTYLLNKFLSIKITASDDANAIDLFYSHSD